MNGIAKGLNDVDDIEIRRLGWAWHILRMEDEKIPPGKTILNEKFPNKVTAGRARKRREKVVQREFNAVPRNNRLEEVGSGCRRVEAP